ncbi:cytochrome c3 family protein [Neotamlana laminarinivorans]|uniref:Cytochrome c3 family protein n=1 Tax=Neotamlana laminarinivorans TaxID=2883124 RepID=A0A9X1HYV1_9FLAO|nr:cytochrome c3 family protein [Tamlana laminarinivorans]MCB4798096.1 cytochrome c3 family protein [Tamlana laminarinivorans]
MFSISPLRTRQVIGGIIGLVVGALVFVLLSLESNEEYVSVGPMNTGHEELSCFACHADAKGNLIQQVQSNTSHAFGFREEGVDFGTQDVTANNCLECHDRPNDRHPIYRFSEPRFSDAIKNIDATTCVTCHSEHHGERVTLGKIDYCMNCHQDLSVESDPLDISHKDLISQEKWETCIQCHDFHGNHRYEVPTQMKDTFSLKSISNYLKGDKDPYGMDKKYTALSQEEWLKKK